ncbi:Ubiquinone/menaquinone biosynthesis C-methylase UbiE [Natronincola peptidivorans]|uniref:Ubiquinone/menaquinone biosynthesis C-methylase UbiE n=1 Tax=Natronincola peptidivorans TaxID=426128 RepID=A0A1I0C9F7_9FIRM|nr:class I SAM-dependent methyltransferase [Natronincola peptidivorans]SET15748.1 Ubiquinone/menaquinone biosynthesis C-methylase UbiE [Natronincola peptidivorans]
MYKIITADRFLWEGIDLHGKIVLEGGTSWGNTTRLIANKVVENNWRTELISVDIDDSHFNEIEEDIKDDFAKLTLRKGDLSDLYFIPSNSIDIIICNYTLSSVEQFPLRVMKAIKELYRVLKKDGQLLITEEMPIWSVDSADYTYWSKRLRIIKSISVLKAMPAFNEIHPNDLEEGLGIIGFKDIQWREFNEKINAEMAVKFLDKRKQTLIKGSNDLENKQLNDGFVEITEKLVKEFEKTKEFLAPAYILKAKK